VSGGIDHGTGSKDATTATSLQLLMPPTVKQDLRFLVITLHKVRGWLMIQPNDPLGSFLLPPCGVCH
jgi:hypothetical protein